MISQKTKYALKALLYLAKHNSKELVLIQDMADAENIPKKFLEAILLDLKNKGFLQSKKGKGGGYMLSKRPDEIVLGQVIRLFDGPLAPVACASQSAYRRCDDCHDEHRCGVRLIMRDVRDAIAGVLDKTTLLDVMGRVHVLEQMGAWNYSI